MVNLEDAEQSVDSANVDKVTEKKLLKVLKKNVNGK